MIYISGILIFLFGASIGSFIEVIASRYNTGLSFLKGRSFCFSCNVELNKKDLIPVFSFLFLRGRCRYCENKISNESFLVEIIMGMLAIFAASKAQVFNFQFSISSLSYFLILLLIFGNILLIAVYDLKHFIIPDSFLVSFFILSLFYLSIFNSFNPSLMLSISYSLLFSNLISGLILTLPFLLIFLISKGTWFGFGDVKYILVLGFFLGFAGGLSAVVLAFWIGATFSLFVLLIKKLKINLPILSNNLTIKSEVPFGPFLSLGILISFYLNADIFQIHSLLNIF